MIGPRDRGLFRPDGPREILSDPDRKCEKVRARYK